MDKRNTIIEELKNICPAVANIMPKNVYTVPFGYFENLPGKVHAFIKQKEQSVLPKPAMPFSIPNNYFESLSEQILQKAKEQVQLNQVTEEIEQGSTLNGLQQNVFKVPTGYFDSLPGLILNKAKKYNEVAEELKEIAPLLNTINKNEVYTVPQGYFESVNIKTSEPVKRGKVISLFARTNKFIKYAAAAVVGGIMITGGILLVEKDNTPQQNVSISSIYKPEQIESLSDEEILEYLNTDSSPADVTAVSEPEQDDIDNSLKDMSEQEINEYLQENSEPGEIHKNEG